MNSNPNSAVSSSVSSKIISNASVVGVVDVDELRDIISSGGPVLVAEVLPAKYYEAGHLPGARHLPLEGFEAVAGSVLADKSAPIVVYCASDTCANSEIA